MTHTIPRRPLIQLKYGSTGPGSGDDQPRLTKAEFDLASAFDAASQDLHVRFASSTTGAMLFDTIIAAGNWNVANGESNKWTVADGEVIRRAVLEAVGGTTRYRLTLIGHNADIDSPAAPLAAGDGVEITIELTTSAGGSCFQATLASCASRRTQDRCSP